MITIVIPAQNEEKRLPTTVLAFSHYFPSADILIVTNNCTDNTEDVARELSRKLKNVQHLSTPGTGKGRAIYAGMLAAHHKYVGFVDADLATAPEEFAKLILHLNNYECVIGSRWLAGAKVTNKEPLKVLFASRALNIIVRFIFNIPVKDSQCGAKVFKTAFVKKIIPLCIVKDITFDVELLWRIRKEGGTIKEVPITWHHNEEGSKTKVIKNSILMIKNMIRMVNSL